VGILDRFEARIDRMVSGAFGRAFEAEVQPVELAAALTSELDDQAILLGGGRTVVPNTFVIDLADSDFGRIMAFERALREELASVLLEHLTAQRYTALGPMTVSFNNDPDLKTGIFRINGQIQDDNGVAVEHVEAAAIRRGPHVVVNGFAHNLTRQHTVLGRGQDADIKVDDTGISRKHCEIELLSPPVLRDLNSTNGTWVHGERITEYVLRGDTDFTVGNTTIQFRLR